VASPSPSWQFPTDFDAARREELEAFESFESLVQRISEEFSVTSFRVSRGKTGIVKNCLRPEFSLSVSEKTGDAFFNSRIGYRAQFLSSPDFGQSCNAQLINNILDRLLAALPSLPAPKHEMPANELRASLSAFSAKAWICEAGFSFDHQLIEDLHVEPWLTSARAAAAAFQRQTAPSPPQQEKAIWGVRAPVNATLDVKGAFLSADGFERVPLDKIHRAHEIHTFGWS
jgi:hypothetical protein